MRLTTTVKKGLAVMAVAAVSFIGVSSMVNAAEQTGTLTIHKYTKTSDNGTQAGTGVTNDDTHKGSGEAVEGVKFTIKKIKNTGDLSTNAQLKIANQIQEGFKTQKTVTEIQVGETPKVKVEFDTFSKEQATGSNGQVSFSNLAKGLYYVYESDVSGAKVNSKNKQVTPAEPFFVTIPFGNSMDVHVYPKNQVSDETTKTPDFSNLKNGKITYTVKAFLPSKPVNGFEKFDLLDKPGSAFEISSFKLTGLKIVDKNSPQQAKQEWTIRDGLGLNQVTEPDLTITEQSGVVNCSFTAAGRKKLDTASQAGGNQVIYTYTLDLKSSFVSTGGLVENKALVVPSPISNTDIDGGSGGTGTPPGVVIDSKKLVSLKIIKQDGADNSKKLAGAQFNIYSCSAAGKLSDADGMTYQDSTGKAAKRAQAQQWNKDPLTSEATSGETKPVLITESTKVCIEEIKAPTDSSASGAPYVLLPEDTVVDTNTVAGDNRNTTQVVNIDNYARNFNFALPMTGANTAIVLSLSGLALIIAAAVLRMRRAKN